MDGFGQVIVAHCSTRRQQSADFVSCEEEQTIRRRSWIHNDLAKEADHTPGFNPGSNGFSLERNSIQSASRAEASAHRSSKCRIGGITLASHWHGHGSKTVASTIGRRRSDRDSMTKAEMWFIRKDSITPPDQLKKKMCRHTKKIDFPLDLLIPSI